MDGGLVSYFHWWAYHLSDLVLAGWPHPSYFSCLAENMSPVPRPAIALDP